VHLYSNFERKTCSKWCSPKRAAPERGRAATSRRPARRGPAPPRRLGPPAHVPKVARVVPRSRLASRRLEHRERPENRAAVRAQYRPAVPSSSSGARVPRSVLSRPLVPRGYAGRLKKGSRPLAATRPAPPCPPELAVGIWRRRCHTLPRSLPQSPAPLTLAFLLL
jgi:hypothetical protein